MDALRESGEADGVTEAITRRFARIAALAATGVGVLVLAGWTLDVGALKGPIPGLITMKANTAFGFTLMGLALWSLAGGDSRGRGLLPAAAAATAFAIGAISFAEYLLARDLGIDQLLFTDAGGAGTVNPGRLAPQTAIVFMLLGTSLLMLRGESTVYRRLGQGLPLAAGTISLFALLGYAYGAKSLSTIGPFSPMAVHTAATALALSLGTLAARPHWSLASTLTAPTAGGIMARRLMPAALVGIPVLGAIRLHFEQAGLYEREMGVALFAIAVVVVLAAMVLLTARALNRADAERAQAAFGQRRLAAIVASSDDAILSTTPEGVVTSWNPGAERLFGYTADEIVGRDGSVLVPVDQQDEAASQRALGEVADGAVRQDEATLVRKDGTSVDASIILSPLREEGGAIMGASAVVRDVTDRRRSQIALEAAKEEAERANRAKSEFLSRMSHELRTPLNAILGFGQLLEMDELQDSQRGDVAQIVKAGRHLLDLINEVLEISRIEAGHIAMSIESVEIDHLLAETVDLIGPLAEERRLTLEVARDEACGSYVRADNQRLKQVLLNLLSNAVKYNREGGRIGISCEEGPDGRLRVAVTDTGPGIPTDRLPSLFTPFERLGAERTAVEGTGLGLALSKRLVEAMDGTLTVESEPGAGTTFTVELEQAAAAQQALDEVPADGSAGVLLAGGSGEPATVLYIEDNISNYRLVEQILVKRPATRLIAAMEGQLGLDLARQHRPDLVLLDLHLPGMTGEEVLAELRADARTAGVAIVVISADATEGQVKRLLAAGADAYLTKPIDVRRFLEVVEEQLGAGVETVA